VTRHDRIVSSFAALRSMCDPRGHDLLAAIEAQALYTHDQLTTIIDGSAPGGVGPPASILPFSDAGTSAAVTAATGADTHSVRVDQLSLPDVGGYPLGSPELHVLREAGEL